VKPKTAIGEAPCASTVWSWLHEGSCKSGDVL
jgi:hypothetical protein